MTPEEIPQELVDLLNQHAGKIHSRTGPVLQSLAIILTRFKEIILAEQKTQEITFVGFEAAQEHINFFNMVSESKHVFPVDDLIVHSIDDDCTCGPSSYPIVSDDGSVSWTVVHHSLDVRELKEGKKNDEIA